MQTLTTQTNIDSDTTKTNPGIVMIESSLLDIGGNPDVCEGIFYMLPLFHEGKLFVR